MQLNVINAAQNNQKISLLQSKFHWKTYMSTILYNTKTMMQNVGLLLQNLISYWFSIDKSREFLYFVYEFIGFKQRRQ